MAPTTNDKLKLLAGTFLLVGATITLLAVAYLFLSPKTFQATTRLRIVDWVKAKDLQKVSDERVVYVECDLIRSNVVVDPVIQDLHLRESWGKIEHQGTSLTLDEARARLNLNTRVRPVPRSSLVDISVASEDPGETAKIANALAHAYLDYRQARHAELIRDKLAVLKKQWDAQNEKIAGAQSTVDKLYFGIIKERSTNETQFYDADAYDLLIGKRAQLKGKYVDQQSQLAQLKKMDRDQLKEVLSSMDTNSPLSLMLMQVNKAKSDLFKAKLDHADNSQEVRQAALLVDKLTEQVGRQIDAAMTLRQTDLDAIEALLKDVDARIKNANTNAAPSTLQDSSYAKAVSQLKELKDERDNLQRTMDDEASQDAIKPTGVMADIIEVAEIPARPVVPDPRIALGGMIAGAVLALIAFVMFLLSQRPKPAIRRAAISR